MLRPAFKRVQRVVTVATTVMVAAIITVGCTPAEPAPSATPTRSPAATPSAPPSTAAPTAAPTVQLQPDGTAVDNLPFFRSITESVWAAGAQVAGRSYIDALVAGGFDRAAMQVTNDTTTIGDAAESIQFSVLWSDGQCLIGQVGPATGAPVTAVLPAVGDDRCLLGKTRPIDW